MFCPNCGAPDQTTESFCRKCGAYLPDFEKLKKKETPFEEHIKVNTFFTVATAAVSATLAVLLYFTFISQGDAPVIIYPVFGFLIAITGWQVQTFIRTRMIKRQFENLRPPRDAELDELIPRSNELLPEPALDDVVPTSVTERTTRDLTGARRKSSSQPE